MRLATFNIYWLGHTGEEQSIGRTDADRDLIARVIARLDADALVFQEIVDPEALQRILARAGQLTPEPRDYRLRDGQGRWLCDNSLLNRPDSQKVFAAYDANKYELRAASPVLGHNRRLPFAARVRRLTHRGEVLIVGVHFKSGQPQFTDAESSETREEQCQHLADWIAGMKTGENPEPAIPEPEPGEHVVVLGDFNALYDADPAEYAAVVPSLDPLREGHMAEWWWEKPLRDPEGGDRTTSYLERLLIDFVMLSPSLRERVERAPTIYAFDQDPQINVADPRVSDHRPVFVEINVRPS